MKPLTSSIVLLAVLSACTGETPLPASQPTTSGGSETSGDFDGDGETDRFVLEERNRDWYARVVTSGESSEIRLAASDLGAAEPSIVGTTDGNGDGRDEAFVILTRGASTVFVTILMLEEAGLAQLGDEQGEPILFGIAGSVTHGEGLRCEPEQGRLVRLRLTAVGTDGLEYRWAETVFRWTGSTLAALTEDRGRIPVDDPMVPRFYELRCGDLQRAL